MFLGELFLIISILIIVLELSSNYNIIKYVNTYIILKLVFMYLLGVC